MIECPQPRLLGWFQGWGEWRGQCSRLTALHGTASLQKYKAHHRVRTITSIRERSIAPAAQAVKRGRATRLAAEGRAWRSQRLREARLRGLGRRRAGNEGCLFSWDTFSSEPAQAGFVAQPPGAGARAVGEKGGAQRRPAPAAVGAAFSRQPSTNGPAPHRNTRRWPVRLWRGKAFTTAATARPAAAGSRPAVGDSRPAAGDTVCLARPSARPACQGSRPSRSYRQSRPRPAA